MTEDEMVGWHHRLDGHGFEETPGGGGRQGGLEWGYTVGSQSRTRLKQLSTHSAWLCVVVYHFTGFRWGLAFPQRELHLDPFMPGCRYTDVFRLPALRVSCFECR